jgi:transcriptional regulator with PAS, ATPase and Fis domain
VRRGCFRLDLYHRLNVLSIHVPALRERDDLEYFIDCLLARIAQREQRPVPEMPDSVRSAFLAFPWHGNVRQLENALLRFVISGDAELDSDPVVENDAPQLNANGHASLNLRNHLDRQRDLWIKRALDKTGNDRDEAARLLGVSRATLYRELRRVEH